MGCYQLIDTEEKNSFSFVLSVEHLSDCRLSAVLCLFVPVSLQLLKHFFAALISFHKINL